LCFSAFPASFSLLVSAKTYQGQGETLPEIVLKLHQRGHLLGNEFLASFLVYCVHLVSFSCVFVKHYIADTLGVSLAQPTPQYRLGLIHFIHCPYKINLSFIFMINIVKVVSA
jgi:hypothetical protein